MVIIQVDRYLVKVTARDLGTPSNTATTEMHVTVSDVNDNPPRFTQSNYTVVVQVSGISK